MKKLAQSVLIFIWLCGSAALGQSSVNAVDELIAKGNLAARNDQHKEAILLYESAIQQQPSVRGALLAKLGRQYLWSEDNLKAAELLGEYSGQHPAECDVRMDYALALSWSNHLRKAKDEYRGIEGRCPEVAVAAELGEARTWRWMDRPGKASRLYESVLQTGNARQKRESEIGLAFNKLITDANREAREDFLSLLKAGEGGSDLYEGIAAADLRLGFPDRAKEDLKEAANHQATNPRMHELAEHIEKTDDLTIEPSFRFFHDADGTNYVSTEWASGLGWKMRSRASLIGGASRLESGGATVGGRWVGANAEHRFNESFAIRAEGRGTHYAGVDFTPFTGELDFIITPDDQTRVDVGVARIVIADNVAALNNHLIGTFVSGGIDRAVSLHDRISIGFDHTQWSDDNRRLRFRVTPAHQLEGVPRVTVSLPMLYVTYDRGFSFNLFSPRSYIELSPAVNVYIRRARFWSLSAYARVGGQKEDALEWKLIGSFQVRAERELWKDWGMQAAASYSNSNLASSSGFSRTGASISVTRRF